jgi:hypothetical protein
MAFTAKITNQISGTYIATNASDDFSLKLVSGDASKNVTLVRLKGPTADREIQAARKAFLACISDMGLSEPD